MSPLLSGAVLTPRSISIIATSILASLWLIRLGYRTPMLVGSVLVTVMLLLGTGWTSVQIGPFYAQRLSAAGCHPDRRRGRSRSGEPRVQQRLAGPRSR